MNNQNEREWNVGGSVEQALSGNYSLKVGETLLEAWRHTTKHWLSFSPAIMVLVAMQLVVFYFTIKLQIGDFSQILTALQTDGLLPEGIIQAILVANVSYEVICVPFYAGVSLMAMSHCVGVTTRFHYFTKALPFTLPLITMTLISLVVQFIGGFLFPLLSMYVALLCSQAALLICEKRLPPVQALWLSIRAVNRKCLPLAAIHLVLLLLFFVALVSYGVGLIIVVPFYFHVKGVIYKTMFGVRVIATHSDPSHPSSTSRVFNA